MPLSERIDAPLQTLSTPDLGRSNVFDSPLKALDFVSDNGVQLPFVCRVKNKQGVEYDAEVVKLSCGSLCISATEPNRLRRDLEWMERHSKKELVLKDSSSVG